ncbi:MAG: TetR/AcrR family transcriptional regulator [Candidatus Neomarinimicrobiota bacterium]
MKKDKKTQIVEAAITVFAREGLERGRISDIAAEAGIGKGTVYEYFRSKDEIFSAIEVAVLGEMMSQINELLAYDRVPSETLRLLMEQGIDAMIEMGDAILIVTELWAQGARGLWHDRGKTSLARIYGEFRDRIKLVLQKGIDSGEFRKMNLDGVATLLMAFMDGLAWQYVLLKDETEFNKARNEAIQSFMKGIEK